MSQSFSLDHVGIGLRNLEPGRVAYERLGFRLTPRSLHHGSVVDGGPVVPWGSGNHCAMFRRGYLEVLGVFDWNAPSAIKDRVQHYEGCHIAAFRCADSRAAFEELSPEIAGLNAPVLLKRQAAIAPDGSEVEVAFANVHLDQKTYPEMRVILIQHLTPAVLWQDHLVTHPNGALALNSIGMCVPDVAQTAERYARLLNARSERREDGYALILPGGGGMELFDGTAYRNRFGGAAPPAERCGASAEIAVEDIGHCGDVLKKNGVRVARLGNGSLHVSADQTGGCQLIFSAA